MSMPGNPNQDLRPNIFGYDCEYPPSTSAWVNSIQTCYQPGASTSTSIPDAFNPFPSRFNTTDSTNNDVIDPLNYFSEMPNNASLFGAQTLSSPFDNTSRTRSASLSTSSTNGYVQSGPSTSKFRTYKRKLRTQYSRASKQHITEDRMAEHLAKLHISSETVTSETEPEQNKAMRLYMCEEMRKLQSETILPQTLLNSIPRPCTALVLWTPPRSLIEQNDYSLNNNNNNNNNEDSVPDANGMDLDLR